MKAQKILLFIVASLIALSSFAQGEDLKPFRRSGKWGYKNNNGAVVIEPQYDEAEPFSEGIAVIKKDNKYGMIDTKGDFVIEPEYGWGIGYHNGYFILDHEILDKNGKRIEASGLKRNNGKSYFSRLMYIRGSNFVFGSTEDGDFVMNINGKIVREDDFTIVNKSKEGLFIICKSDRKYRCHYGIMDTTGRIVIKPKFSDVGFFSEGLATASNWRVSTNPCTSILIFYSGIPRERKYDKGFIDTKGKWVIKPQYFYVDDFHNGLAFVYSDYFCGLIDKNGNRVIDFTSQMSYGSSSYFKRIVNRHIVEGDLVAKWLGNGETLIQYWGYAYDTIVTTEQGPIKLVYGDYQQREFIVDEKGDVLYFIGDNGEKLDKDGKTIVKDPTAITIKWDSIPAIIENKQLKVIAKIISNSKIEHYQILRNDEAYSMHIVSGGTKEDKTTKGAFTPGGTFDENNGTFEYSINEPIELLEGDNKIVIETQNEAGGIVRIEQSIFYHHVEKRLALVIGNKNYQSLGKLNNPENDAKAIYSLLEASGYDMQPIVIDANKTEMERAINGFIERIEKENYEVALFYFSGHGISPTKDENYLIPIKDSISCVIEARTRGVDVQSVLLKKMRKLNNCRVRIAFLDCCRSCRLPEICDDANPHRSDDYTGGMSILETEGVAIVYATQDRKTADDGSGKNSPFVEGILDCAKDKNQNWPSFVSNLRDYVKEHTSRKQIPQWVGYFDNDAGFKPFKK